MNQKLNKRKCKECNDIFQKRQPLDMFCSQKCNRSYQNRKRKENIIAKKELSAEKNTPSESDVFKEIWESLGVNQRKSFVSGKILSDNINARVWYFSHVLPKGKNKYPMFKYYKKNIVLKEFKEHELWEHHQYKLKNDSLWSHVFKLKEELIKEYEEHLKLFEKGLVEYYKL